MHTHQPTYPLTMKRLLKSITELNAKMTQQDIKISNLERIVQFQDSELCTLKNKHNHGHAHTK